MQPSPAASSSTRGSSSATKNHPPGSRTEVEEMGSLDTPMHGSGLPLDGYTAAYLYHHHPPQYPNVNGTLGVTPAVPFGNPTFPVSGWHGDSSLPPTPNLIPQGYAQEMDNLGRYLDQQRHAMEYHDMQSHAKSSTASWSLSDRAGQFTDSSTAPDRITPSDSVSACENEISVGPMSTQASLSKHGSRMSSRSPGHVDGYSSATDIEVERCQSSRVTSTKNSPKPTATTTTTTSTSVRRQRNSTATTNITQSEVSTADPSGTVGARIASAMKSIRAHGFSGIEELTAQFYTADLQDQPGLADAQRISRRRGLTRILAKLRENAKEDWSDWEAQGYREEIVRAAEDILGEECRRYVEVDEDNNSKANDRNLSEMKREFQDEVSTCFLKIRFIIPNMLTYIKAT